MLGSVLTAVVLFMAVLVMFLSTERLSELVTADLQDEKIEDVSTEYQSLKGETLRLISPTENSQVTSPLKLSGYAPGYWFFEATFPVVLTDWNGLIIAEGYATAEEDWMTESMVPFTAELEYEKPSYGERGSLILQRANVSGLPMHEDAVEFVIFFGE